MNKYAEVIDMLFGCFYPAQCDYAYERRPIRPVGFFGD